MIWTRSAGLALVAMIALSGCATAPRPAPPEAAETAQAELQAAFSAAVEALEQGQLANARARFQALAEANPEKAGPLANLGIIAFREGDLEAAQGWFERTLAVNPNHVTALNHLGVIARRKGEFGRAEDFYRAALAEAPEYAPAILNLAFLLDIYLGQPAEALALYERYQSVASEPHPRLEDWIFDANARL